MRLHKFIVHCLGVWYVCRLLCCTTV